MCFAAEGALSFRLSVRPATPPSGGEAFHAGEERFGLDGDF